MQQSSYRWVIVAAGGFMGCIAIGSMFSLPVFLTPMSAATGWSRTEIALAMTLDFITMGIGGFCWGMLMDRYGPRVVVMSGSLILGLGLTLASRSTSVLMFQLRYGILVGAGAGAIFAPMMATVTGWFETQRSLAVSLVSAGMGIAPMTVAPTAAILVSHFDWRTSQLIIGLAAWALLLPTSLLVRRAPALVRKGPAAAQDQLTLGAALRSPQFLTLAAVYFFCCATHSGPLFHTVSYAIYCGLPPLAAVSIYSVEGFAGLFGRIGFGLAGDRFGAKRVFVSGLLIQAFAAGAYFFAREQFQFYSVAVIFGFTYAGIMPLYAVMVRENFPLHIIGSVMGATSMASSLGMALGPLAGGVIFDTLGTYGWLYIGSFAVGLTAMVIMLTFRPAQRAEAPALAPAG